MAPETESWLWHLKIISEAAVTIMIEHGLLCLKNGAHSSSHSTQKAFESGMQGTFKWGN